MAAVGITSAYCSFAAKHQQNVSNLQAPLPQAGRHCQSVAARLLPQAVLRWSLASPRQKDSAERGLVSK